MYTKEEREKMRKMSYTERLVGKSLEMIRIEMAEEGFDEPLPKEDQAHLDSIKEELVLSRL